VVEVYNERFKGSCIHEKRKAHEYRGELTCQNSEQLHSSVKHLNKLCYYNSASKRRTTRPMGTT